MFFYRSHDRDETMIQIRFKDFRWTIFMKITRIFIRDDIYLQMWLTSRETNSVIKCWFCHGFLVLKLINGKRKKNVTPSLRIAIYLLNWVMPSPRSSLSNQYSWFPVKSSWQFASNDIARWYMIIESSLNNRRFSLAHKTESLHLEYSRLDGNTIFSFVVEFFTRLIFCFLLLGVAARKMENSPMK